MAQIIQKVNLFTLTCIGLYVIMAVIDIREEI